MQEKVWRVGVPVAVVALAALLGAVQAQDDKAIDGGKAEEFKGKKFDIKAKGKVKIELTFPADKEAALTVRSEKESDIHLFVYGPDGKLIDKDDSPGPSCDLKLTPKKAGKLTIEIVNEGPADNTSTLKVSFGNKK